MGTSCYGNSFLIRTMQRLGTLSSLSSLMLYKHMICTYPNNLHIFEALCDLFALYGIVENGQEFLQDGYMSSEQMDMVRTQFYDLLEVIR